MIALARKTLVYEWRRFVPVVLAVGFSGLMLVAQAALVLGIFGTAAIYVKASSADLWVGYPGTQSVNFGQSIDPDVAMRLRMDPDVLDVEPYEWVDGDWRAQASDSGSVSVYLSGVSVSDGAMMFDQLLGADMRARLREPGAVIVDEADLQTLGLNRDVSRAWINGKPVRVVGLLRGLRGLGGVNVLASVDTAREVKGSLMCVAVRITWLALASPPSWCRPGLTMAQRLLVPMKSGRLTSLPHARNATGCWIPAQVWRCCSWP